MTAEQTTFYLGRADLLRLLALAMLLPSTVMSLTSLAAGEAPLAWGPMLFVVGFVLLGYRRQIRFSRGHATVERRSWGVTLHSRRVPLHDIQAISILRSEHQRERWEKDHNGDYVARETGGTYTSVYYRIHWPQETDVLVPQQEMTEAQLQAFARAHGLRFYPPGRTPPQMATPRGVPWLQILVACFILTNIGFIADEIWHKHRLLGDARAAAEEIGIEVEPNLPDTPLTKGTWVLVYVEAQGAWRDGIMIIDSPSRSNAFVKYMQDDEPVQDNVPRDILRLHEEI